MSHNNNDDDNDNDGDGDDDSDSDNDNDNGHWAAVHNVGRQSVPECGVLLPKKILHHLSSN